MTSFPSSVATQLSVSGIPVGYNLGIAAALDAAGYSLTPKEGGAAVGVLDAMGTARWAVEGCPGWFVVAITAPDGSVLRVLEVRNAKAGTVERHVLGSASGVPDDSRVFAGPLPVSGAFTLASGTVYSVYLGRAPRSVTPKHVEFALQGLALGTAAVEVALASTPGPPAKAGQTLTKIAAEGALDSSLLSGGVRVVRNQTAFTSGVAAGTHLWACVRAAFGITQPTVGGIVGDFSQGFVLTTAGASALTGLSSWAGSVLADAVGAGASPCGPGLRATLD